MIIPSKRFFIIFASGFVFTILGFYFPSLGFLQFIFYGILLIICAIDFFYVPKRRDMEISRKCSKYLSIGVDNPVKISVRNYTGRDSTVLIRDGYPMGFLVEKDTLQSKLTAHGVVTLTYYIKPVKKGEYKFEKVFVRVLGKFGLLFRQYKIPIITDVMVYPNIIEVKKYLKMSQRNRLEQIGYKKRISGGESEFDFLREYQQGDEYRKINWKASARRNFPIVRVDRQEYNRNVMVLVDEGRMMTTRYGFLSKLDYAVDATLVLAASALQNNDHFGFVSFHKEIDNFLAPSRKARALTSVLTALYKASPDFVKSDYFNVYRLLKNRLRKNSIIFVFSELYNEVVSRDLVRFLKMLSMRHRVFFISFEEIEREAEGKDLREMTRWALQLEQTVEKETIIRDLSKKGVHTIRVNPENIKQRVVNSYLSV
jgi:uncharacterized protein (DUF58 family)